MGETRTESELNADAWAEQQAADALAAQQAADALAAQQAADALAAQQAADALAVRPVRVITPEIISAAGISNGMSAEVIDAKIEAVFVARGE
jgi:hypothetical protein